MNKTFLLKITFKNLGSFSFPHNTSHPKRIYLTGCHMNIKNNIVNYLYDKDYCICLYDNNFYVFNYTYLENFNDKRITIELENKREIKILGDNLTIVKITKEELLIKGNIKTIEFKGFDEKEN